MKLEFFIIFLCAISLFSCQKEGYLIQSGQDQNYDEGYTTTTSFTGKGAYNNEINAGEWRDTEEWSFWNELRVTHNLDNYSSIWGMHPYQRLNIRLVNEGEAVPNRKVVLKIDGILSFSTMTDIKGEAILWYFLNSSDVSISPDRVNLEIDYMRYRDSLILSADAWNVIEYDESDTYLNGVEIAFVTDATGSMGKELAFFQENVSEILTEASDKLETSIRSTGIFYRDENDTYLVRNSGWQEDETNLESYFNQQSASGGGDFPEAVDVGLSEAISGMDWSDSARSRIIFLILDAPPRKNPYVLQRLYNTVLTAAQNGIKIIPVTSHGISRDTEFLMRFIALTTNGTYVFCTEESETAVNINDSTVGIYEIESLKELLIRLIIEEST